MVRELEEVERERAARHQPRRLEPLEHVVAAGVAAQQHPLAARLGEHDDAREVEDGACRRTRRPGAASGWRAQPRLPRAVQLLRAPPRRGRRRSASRPRTAPTAGRPRARRRAGCAPSRAGSPGRAAPAPGRRWRSRTGCGRPAPRRAPPCAGRRRGRRGCRRRRCARGCRSSYGWGWWSSASSTIARAHVGQPLDVVGVDVADHREVDPQRVIRRPRRRAAPRAAGAGSSPTCWRGRRRSGTAGRRVQQQRVAVERLQRPRARRPSLRPPGSPAGRRPPRCPGSSARGRGRWRSRTARA